MTFKPRLNKVLPVSLALFPSITKNWTTCKKIPVHSIKTFSEINLMTIKLIKTPCMHYVFTIKDNNWEKLIKWNVSAIVMRSISRILEVFFVFHFKTKLFWKKTNKLLMLLTLFCLRVQHHQQRNIHLTTFFQFHLRFAWIILNA